MRKLAKLIIVIVGAIALTALGIDAADTLSGSRATLFGQIFEGANGVCPRGMVEIPAATSFTCVDMFEVSPGEACGRQTVANNFDTELNLGKDTCEPTSQAGEMPWRFVSRDQAQTLCLRAGKRLPTAGEWHLLSLGTADTGCNILSQEVETTGAFSDCRSALGVHDAVGNVWEWVSGDVIDGNFQGLVVAPTGYVAATDGNGVAIQTSTSSISQFGDDYFWSNPVGVYAMIRGGFYGSGSDAGVYAVHADIATDFYGEAVGFRCVQ